MILPYDVQVKQSLLIKFIGKKHSFLNVYKNQSSLCVLVILSFFMLNAGAHKTHVK